MGLITQITISTRQDSSAASWYTDVDATTEMELFRQDSAGNYNQVSLNPAKLPIGDSTVHNYDIPPDKSTGGILIPGNYRCRPKSYDNANMEWCTYENNTDTFDFTISAPAVKVVQAVRLVPRLALVKKGHMVRLYASALDSLGAGISGKDVTIDISPANLVSVPPGTMSTDASGSSNINLTGDNVGKVTVTATIDGKTDSSKVICWNTIWDLLRLLF